MDQKKTGNFLRELRKSTGFTQEQVAEKIGVSSRTISRWETGAYMPDISMLVDIAGIYDVDIREIIDGERKEDDMNSEVKEVAEKMADYSTMEKNNILKWFRMFSLGTFVLSICMIIVHFIMPFVVNKAIIEHDIHTTLNILLMSAINPNALMLYVTVAFSLVALICASGKIKSIGQNSKTVVCAKITIIAAIILSVAIVVEYIIFFVSYTKFR